MRDNEFSCYYLNSSGQHIVHGSIYIVLKSLLIFLIHCICQKRIKNIQQKMESNKATRSDERTEKLNIEPKIAPLSEVCVDSQDAQEKLTLAQRFVRLMVKLNLRINLKFFVNVLATFQIELLMSAFGNFRFLNTNSTFAAASMICSVLTLILVVFVISISTQKTHQIRVLREKILTTLQTNSETSKNIASGKQTLEDEIKKLPWLSSWGFVIEGMNPGLVGVWSYFLVFQNSREVVTILFIFCFIGKPMLQIIPCSLLALVSCLVIAVKKPFEGKLDHI